METKLILLHFGAKKTWKHTLPSCQQASCMTRPFCIPLYRLGWATYDYKHICPFQDGTAIASPKTPGFFRDAKGLGWANVDEKPMATKWYCQVYWNMQDVAQAREFLQKMCLFKMCFRNMCFYPASRNMKLQKTYYIIFFSKGTWPCRM